MILFLRVWWLFPAISASEYVPVDTSTLANNTFFEQFLAPSLAQSGWITSKTLKSDGLPYKGQWELQESYIYPGFLGDKGLVMVSEADFFGISRALPTSVQTDGQDLVFQFEVKFQEGVTCGGAYLKLVSGLDPELFSDQSRYEIMFGPDICGSENRVQLIIKKDKTDPSEGSRLRTPPMAKSDNLSALYTLVIRANNDMEIRINGGMAKAGNLLNTPNLMVPPISVPEFIPDMAAQKPESWDDRPLVLDTTAEKPADYDELYNTMWVADSDAEQPGGWNGDENASVQIPDPNASKPDEWDDAEDGTWKAPLILNPRCMHGCGKWKPPKVVNPNYKGEWVPPAVENPAYKGPWKRPLVANPDYGRDSNAGFRPIDGIGIDVWSMQSGVMFNNIYLGHSVAEAERIGNETFAVKLDLEYANYKRTKPWAKHEPRTPPKSFDDLMDERGIIVSKLTSSFYAEIASAQALWSMFQHDPVPTMMRHPFRFAGYCFLSVVGFTFVFGVANVLLFLYLSSREEATAHDRKYRAEAEEKRAEKVDDEMTEKEVITQITGKSTGAKVSDTSARKVR